MFPCLYFCRHSDNLIKISPSSRSSFVFVDHERQKQTKSEMKGLIFNQIGISDSFAVCCKQYIIHLIREERSLRIGDRTLAINDYNVAHFTLLEASVFLQQSGREVSLLVEYDVSLMGEHHRLETATQCYLTWCLDPETNVVHVLILYIVCFITFERVLNLTRNL